MFVVNVIYDLYLKRLKIFFNFALFSLQMGFFWVSVMIWDIWFFPIEDGFFWFVEVVWEKTKTKMN